MKRKVSSSRYLQSIISVKYQFNEPGSSNNLSDKLCLTRCEQLSELVEEVLEAFSVW